MGWSVNTRLRITTTTTGNYGLQLELRPQFYNFTTACVVFFIATHLGDVAASVCRLFILPLSAHSSPLPLWAVLRGAC